MPDARLSAEDRIEALLRAVNAAERGGATVMRLDTVRAIVGATVTEPDLDAAPMG